MILTTLKSSAKAALERWACLTSRFALLTSNTAAVLSLTQIFALLQVLLARHKESTKYYAVKVLQKKIIMKKKEVSPSDIITNWNIHRTRLLNNTAIDVPWLMIMSTSIYSFQQKHIMAERSVLMKNIKHPFLVGLHYSFQTTDKLYFVLDYVNGGEVSSSLTAPRNGAQASLRSEHQSVFSCRCWQMFVCFLSSCSTISRERGYSWSPEPGSMLLKLQVHSATSTPCTLCTGKEQSCSAPWWTFATMICAEVKLCHFFFFTGTWSLRTSCWTHRATLSSQTLASAKKVLRPMVRHLHSAERLRYKTKLSTLVSSEDKFTCGTCVDSFFPLSFLTVLGPGGPPEAGVRPHSWLVVSGIGAVWDALRTCKWESATSTPLGACLDMD